jgi:hypothetical protein
MIEIDAHGRNAWPMNPIALVETTTATRRAVLGALATDAVVPTPSLSPGRLAVSILRPLIRAL